MKKQKKVWNSKKIEVKKDEEAFRKLFHFSDSILQSANKNSFS